MRKPQVIKLNKAVGQTAFLLGDSCPYKHDISGLRLTLSRCERDYDEITFSPTHIDEHGYVVFIWGNDIKCLDEGFYIGTFEYRCHDIQKVFFQIEHDECSLHDVIHTPKSNCQDNLCQSAGDGLWRYGDCNNTPCETYIPRYEINRGL